LSAGTNSPTWCKICGVTSISDAQAAADAGADAVGMNFYLASARSVAIDVAASISEALHRHAPHCARVGLFVDHSEADVRAVVESVSLDLLQFHGSETAEFCNLFDMPYIKVLSMKADIDIDSLERQYASAWALLLDTYDPTQAGGTGKTFDWQLWPDACQMKLILAGGLTITNVSNAITQTRPFGVDVSGGVEGDTKGVKHLALMQQFIKEAKNVRSIRR
jgi:phosphoribosylanthranilate isomerase